MNTLINISVSICCLALGASSLSQETGGIGLVLGKKGENLVVNGILPDSVAAWSKAVRVGDRVIAVAQENMPPVQVEGLNLDEEDFNPNFATSLLYAPDVMNHRRQSGEEMVQDLELPLIPCFPGQPEIGMSIQVLHIDDDERRALSLEDKLIRLGLHRSLCHRHPLLSRL